MADLIVSAGGREVAISSPDKVLFPDAGITKADLARYWARVADTALPHYRGRPLSMERYPDGIAHHGFFQKDMPEHFPDWVGRAELAKEGGTVTYMVAEDAASLVYLADQGVITPHLGLSRVDRIDAPDRLVLDLDPSDGDFLKVQRAARMARDLFEALGARPFVRTSGSRGLHVVLALDRSADFGAARAFARRFAEALAARAPDLLTVEQRKAKRGDRVFLDVLRNAYGQTAVGSYAPRARPEASVATPLAWHEALRTGLGPRDYTLRNIHRRLAQKADPWRDMDRHACAVAALAERLDAAS